MQTTIGGQAYTLCDRVREDPARRAAFYALARQVFDLDFAPWHALGYWGDNYIPHVLYQGERAVSCVAVSLMDAHLAGRAKNYIQLGTVMTHPLYRGRGLARHLMEHVLQKYPADTTYLFANDGAVSFYPRFGFAPRDEVIHQLTLSPRPGEVRPLDMDRAQDRAVAAALIEKGSDLALLDAGGVGLTMFYLTGPLKTCAYLVDGALVVAQQEEDGLTCHAIYGGASLEGALCPLLNAPGRVRLGFTPRQAQGFEASPWREDDTTLMVRGGDPFGGKPMRFPALSHA